MASFLEDVNQMVIDACYQEIAEQLLENWINSNLDEGNTMLISNLLGCQMISLFNLNLISSIT